jgi:hypothetical protein
MPTLGNTCYLFLVSSVKVHGKYHILMLFDQIRVWGTYGSDQFSASNLEKSP